MTTFLALFVAAQLAVLARGGALEEPEDARVYQGFNAVKGQFPYTVLITFEHMDGQPYRCTGSLLSDTWVLTAAHCVLENKNMKMYIGVVDVGKPLTEGEFIYYPDIPDENKHAYPEYDRERFANDIALVELPTKAPIDKYKGIVSTIRATSDVPVETYEPKWATAVGWGMYNDTVQTSTLRYSAVNIITNKQCEKFIRENMPPTMHFGKDEICTGKNSKKGACAGDSGGPLVFREQRSKEFITIGVAAAVTGPCSDPKTPVIYTYIGAYLDWIEEVSGLSY